MQAQVHNTADLKQSEAAQKSEAFKQTVASDFKAIQDKICEGLQTLDKGFTFERKPWTKKPGEQLQGHGEMAVLKGKTFEKAGVNFSHVHGVFSEQFAKEIPGALESNGQFWACGVSLVIHPKSPLVPIVHMNIRRIETSKSWFGGGSDLTPTFPFEEDTQLFHDTLKASCDAYDENAYEKMSKACDEYFFIKHWNETRGVGGIFFDAVNSGDEMKDYDFVKDTADAFLKAYTEIVSRRMNMEWTAEQKEAQYAKRAKYVEFNLLYDRGTRFGFMTGGNPEAILMSMPPVAKWP